MVRGVWICGILWHVDCRRRGSVERFKRSMGGRRRDFSYLDLRGPAYPIVRNPVVIAARRIGSRLRTR